MAPYRSGRSQRSCSLFDHGWHLERTLSAVPETWGLVTDLGFLVVIGFFGCRWVFFSHWKPLLKIRLFKSVLWAYRNFVFKNIRQSSAYAELSGCSVLVNPFLGCLLLYFWCFPSKCVWPRGAFSEQDFHINWKLCRGVHICLEILFAAKALVL